MVNLNAKGDFNQDSLKSHNECRKKHNVQPLKWSNTLANNAQSWAEHLGKIGRMQHADSNQRKGQGENIYCSKGKELDGYSATEAWYSEIKDYDFTKKPTFNSKTGHFTQVVWAESTELGVGRAKSASGMDFVVARYSPMGNNMSTFADNVRPPTGDAQVGRPDKSANDNKPDAGKKAVTNKITKAATPSPLPKSKSSGNFDKDFLAAHNEYRKKHNVPSLTLSKKLCTNAQKWADHLAMTGRMQHADANERGGEGENLYASKGMELDGHSVTTKWYDEIKDYDFTGKPRYIPNTGHFTQVVWSETKELGVGRSKAPNGMEFVVGRYYPAGNNLSTFPDNINPPGGSSRDTKPEKSGLGITKRDAKPDNSGLKITKVTGTKGAGDDKGPTKVVLKKGGKKQVEASPKKSSSFMQRQIKKFRRFFCCACITGARAEPTAKTANTSYGETNVAYTVEEEVQEFREVKVVVRSYQS